MMDELNGMTLEKFQLWSEHALKVFLSVRKKSTEGDFCELAARAFCAWEENIETDNQAELAEYQLLEEYKSKLRANGQVLPDPLNLKDGWKSEKLAMEKWPSIYITDIAGYLNKETESEMVNRLLNDYKEGKAYRYFSCGWVKDVLFHNICSDSRICFLKTKVTPSQAVRRKAYDVWVAVKLDTDSIPGGEIISAYCTCTAGMFGSCNHIAGLLFRIEYAVKTGLTQPVGTSKSCSWNVPSKPDVKPIKVADVVWRKSSYHRRVSLTEEKEKSQKKHHFTPLREHHKTAEMIRSELHHIVSSEAPNSCFVSLMEKKKQKSEQTKLPPTLTEVANELSKSNYINQQTEQLFLERLSVTDKEIVEQSNATENQSKSDVWREQRRGRLTASLFHRISSRARTLFSNPKADPSALVGTILGHNSYVQTKAMKHGISLEPNAKREYYKTTKKGHKHFKITNCGMFIYQPNPYIAASPDLLVECSCCGAGLCEIKCPESIKQQAPTSDNVYHVLK